MWDLKINSSEWMLGTNLDRRDMAYKLLGKRSWWHHECISLPAIES